jgi:4-amino-4-deoxychorismate lyase
MYQLVETIKVIDGIPRNLYWHQKRYEHSCKSLFGVPSNLKLESIIVIPESFKSGKVKARFLYNREGYRIEFRNYTAVPVKSLMLIENDSIDYDLKFINRSSIKNMLLNKGKCDDILIVKKGRITDTSIANIVFFNGEKWFTPELPLLRGTCRERLLSEEKISALDIHTEDLNLFTHFRLINAMLEFEEQEMLHISSIK